MAEPKLARPSLDEPEQRDELARRRQEIERLKQENARLRAEVRRLRRQQEAHAESSGHLDASGSPTDINGVRLPAPIAHFAPAIERSHEMTQLQDGWDGDESLGYDEATWRRAVDVAIRSASRFVSTRDERVPAPAIAKGPEGSIAIVWRWGSKQFMIDVPSDVGEPVTYHGYDREKPAPETGGTLDLAVDNEWVLAWLSS